MNEDLELCAQILRDLATAGTREFCLCAGARNAALFFLLTRSRGIRLYSFFDERSAAFFALGRAKRTGKPVAVVTTSGTAAAELLPAAIEAHYSGWPLVLLTADRPRSYRGTGAPQSIEQVGLFATHDIPTLDIESREEWPRSPFGEWRKELASSHPLHINICLQEPSALERAEGVDFTAFGTSPAVSTPLLQGAGSGVLQGARSGVLQGVGNEIEIDRPLVIVGALRDSEREIVLSFLRRQKAPVYAEVISQLRGEESLAPRMLSLTDLQMREACQSGEFRSILRLGGVPTTRLWRDLEGVLADFPVLSVANTAWSGLSKARPTKEPFRHWNSLAFLSRLKITGFSDGDIAGAAARTTASPRDGREESLLRTLSDRLLGQNIYLGNSLPIREWDRVARGPYRRVEANRGANGIDGQVSTFLGWSEGEAGDGEFWGVVGDLTALYDLQSLWVTPQLTKIPRRLVVIHNSGGRIFEKMFRHPAFLNEHQLDFSHWARMFGWAFESWTEIPANLERNEPNLLIELRV